MNDEEKIYIDCRTQEWPWIEKGLILQKKTLSNGIINQIMKCFVAHDNIVKFFYTRRTVDPDQQGGFNKLIFDTCKKFQNQFNTLNRLG